VRSAFILITWQYEKVCPEKLIHRAMLFQGPLFATEQSQNAKVS
jgi:hypothetical protein